MAVGNDNSNVKSRETCCGGNEAAGGRAVSGEKNFEENQDGQVLGKLIVGSEKCQNNPVRPPLKILKFGKIVLTSNTSECYFCTSRHHSEQHSRKVPEGKTCSTAEGNETTGLLQEREALAWHRPEGIAE